MELWIRSQDRKSLIKSNGVGLTPSEISIYPIGLNGVLGTYETKERAVEVLDEIQDKMLNGAFAKKINGLGEELDLIPNPILIYNMPED